MSSRRSGQPAQRRPRVRVAPRALDLSDAEDAFDLGAGYGLTLDPWQHEVLRDWMGRDRLGGWTSTICGLAVPRQNGKNAIIEVRELFGMIELGEKFLHTAHEVKTARKAFLRIASFFENSRTYPELAALVKEIRRTNGQEAIVLDNGGSVEFVARSKSSARGFTVDTVIFDEAQEIQDESMEALAPTNSASPLGNPQKVFTGTCPGPKANGDIWRDIHREGEVGTTARMAWTDFGVIGPMPDIDDLLLLRETNPGYPVRLTPEGVADDRVLFKSNPEGFARERYGWWGDDDATGVFPDGSWQGQARTKVDPKTGLAVSQITGPVAVALDVSWDRNGCALAVAGRCDEGQVQGELVEVFGRYETPVTIATLVAAAAEVVKAHGARGVWLEPASAAGSLMPALKDAGVRVFEVRGQVVNQACGAVYDAVLDGSIVHLGQAALDTAVGGTQKRNSGDAWRWDRRQGADISPFMAYTFAVHAAMGKKPAGNGRVIVLS